LNCHGDKQWQYKWSINTYENDNKINNYKVNVIKIKSKCLSIHNLVVVDSYIIMEHAQGYENHVAR
jgi:hypothetical protein